MEKTHSQPAALNEESSHLDVHYPVVIDLKEPSDSVISSFGPAKMPPLDHNVSSPEALPEEERLHAIVGHRLAIPPSLPEMEESSSPSQSLSSESQQSTPTITPATFTVSAVDGKTVNDFTTPNSHFQLQGGADSSDVYKWHERQTRRQLGSRSYSYHALLDKEQLINSMKAPGGFRRHFIRQEAVSRGEPTPQIPTKSFIHFLGLFDMRGFDRFAGEDFHSIPRRSIIVPKDKVKRRLSIAESLTSRRYFVPGEHLKEDEEAIEEPEEKISFSKAVGMLFKT